MLGVVFAVVVSRPLADEGFILSIPVGTLLMLLVLAAIAGVIAAIGPARRASKPRRARGARLRVAPAPRAPSQRPTERIFWRGRGAVDLR